MLNFSLLRPALFWVSLIGLIFTSSAQNQLSHPAKTYRSAEGKLYWNKELPVYVKLATSPDDNGHVLQSEEHAEYTSPYYFDTDGTNYMRTRYAVDKETKKTIIPEVEVLWEVYVDGLSPQTTLHHGTTNLFDEGGIIYASNDLAIDFKSKDGLSGVEATYVSVNGAPFSKSTDQFNFSEEKLYTIKYYSVDRVGNAEPIRSEKIALDISTPETQHFIGGAYTESVLSRKATISLNSKDKASGVSKIMYSIDGSEEMVYGGKIYLSWLEEGPHKITYYAIDNVNNKEVYKTFEFFIDRTSPTVVSEVVGDMYNVNGRTYYSGRTKLTLTAIDNKAGIESLYYSVNGSDFTEYKAPVGLPTSASALTIRNYGVDNVGNKSDANGEASNLFVYADLSGPSLNVHYDGPTFETRDTIFISRHTQINLEANDPKSGLQRVTYQVNKGEEKVYSKAFTLDKEDFYHVDFVGYDNVNNTNKSDFYFYVDNTGPEPYTTFSIDPIGSQVIDGRTVNVYSKHLQLFLAATDAHVGLDRIEYSLNDGKDKLYTGIVKNFQKGKVYKIKLKAYDTLGNLGEKDFYFMIEK